MADKLLPVAEAVGLPVIAPEADGREGTVPYVVKVVDGVKVGVVAFNSLMAKNDNMETAKKRIAAYSAARKESDILVVLDQGLVATDEWLERMGKRLGEPDIVVPSFMHTSQPGVRTVGKARITPPSSQARHVGVYSIQLVPGESPMIEFSQTELVEKIEADPEINEVINAYNKRQQVPMEVETVQEEQQEPEQQAGAPVPAHEQVSAPPVFREEPYHNPDTCKSCHERQYASWAEGKHANSLLVLVEQGKMMPECLKCHSEIFRKGNRLTTSGNLSNGVVCASCHSDVLPHDSNYKATGKAVRDVGVCIDCHDKANSPNFDEKIYWLRSAHGQVKK